MHLLRLEVQGFKTFAKKTSLDFTSKKKIEKALTVIVGPNGSGKSNLADAMRWCLGEQSMKQLRGKKTEDIIFSGSEGKARSGFAEVSMTFDNHDKSMKIDYTEVTISRRIFRDGAGEYLLNGKKVRLSDIQLLLAEAGVGQRTYSVIGQGMIDHILTSSPEERKVFFDDATGVRGLQIKRHQSMLKLRKASDNLAEVELLLHEIEPRLKSLRRQVKRLEKREKVETDLRELQDRYYQSLWWNLQHELNRLQEQKGIAHTASSAKREELKNGDKELEAIEKSISGAEDSSSEITEAHTAYKAAQERLSVSRKKEFEAERSLELDKVKARSNWSPLPLHEIIAELETIESDQTELLSRVKEIKTLEELEELTGNIDKVFERSRGLKTRLTKPNPEDYKPKQELVDAINTSKKEVVSAQHGVKEIEHKIDDLNKAARSSKTEIFSFQRKLRELQEALYKLEQKENAFNIDLARTETRIESLETEMREEIPKRREEIKKKDSQQGHTDPGVDREQILRLKRELELIGGIDDETITEYKETEERFSFLSEQVRDIRAAIKSTEKIIDGLDEQITSQSEKAFKKINTEFQKYFKILFGGGSCSLIKLKEDDVKKEKEEETKLTLDRAMEALAEDKIEEDSESVDAIMKRVKKRKDHVAGIDIQATPPGKKLKSLNLLSGGERALTSIALLSAIMAINPSPFVVLDEVDAALDESNTIRFASILTELQKLTQFIVITHNRATMERGDLLYGVTMGQDGISNLLSVSMTEIEEQVTARR
jgi:chromosome segregation protein